MTTQDATTPHAVAEIDHQVLTGLAGHSDPVQLAQLCQQLKLDQSQVSAVCLLRSQQGQIDLTEETRSVLKLGKKGQAMVGVPFPERTIARALESLGGRAEMPVVAHEAGIDAKEVGQTLRYLKSKGWADQVGKELVLTEKGKTESHHPQPDEVLTNQLEGHEREATPADDEALKLLEGRSGIIDARPRVLRSARLTAVGREFVGAGLEVRKEVTALTNAMLLSGEWRNVDLRPYDVTKPAEPVYAGKVHPLVRIFQQTRQVFLELGFTETVSPYVESSFWDFDALFQPQDHPARDMQDTFYVARPAVSKLPDEAIVEAVGRTHRDGGDTGSSGWRYDWDREITTRPVLRTHTTASTIRALAADPTAPRKVFCVGPVFRRETVDYKHLPVFHQVDGIIIDEHGSFASLLGTLKAFYTKMGFKRFQFRPAFFPYTEPSVEIFVWSDKKNDWVEMGGAGMFRPEVTRPLGCTSPVLAWGLGLERLAMFSYDLSSIGELYRARLQWLKETALR
jgi:phenylalanyl-tRNA synthetase alpha chain